MEKYLPLLLLLLPLSLYFICMNQFLESWGPQMVSQRRFIELPLHSHPLSHRKMMLFLSLS